jgi:hypothetical protein
MLDSPVTDEVLLQAIRKRLLDEIAEQQQASSIINNNVYGAGQDAGQQAEAPGIAAGMQGQDMSPEERSYFVDILKQEYEPGDTTQFYDPESGGPSDVELKHGGWGKRVHRFSTPKKKEMMAGQ